MLTLLVALAGLLLLGAAGATATWEGTIKLPGILMGSGIAKLGRVGILLYTYRPGRCYVRLGVAR